MAEDLQALFAQIRAFGWMKASAIESCASEKSISTMCVSSWTARPSSSDLIARVKSVTWCSDFSMTSKWS